MEILTFLLFVLEFTVILTLGFIAGVMTKGVHINITKKEPEPIPKDKIVYNESTAGDLPDEIKTYFDQNQGFIK